MTGRFSPPVAAVLRQAGWEAGRQLPPAALAAMHQAVGSRTGQFGGRLARTRAADQVLTEFGGLTVHSDLPGVELRPSEFTVDPALLADRVEALLDVGHALGVPVYPLGTVGPERSPLVLTEPGAVIAVDPVGEWFLGGTIEEALDLLITGRQPRPVTIGGGQDGFPSLPRPGGAAFYLPRTPLNLPYVWLPDALTRIGVVPAAGTAHPGRFEIEDWGGLRCEVDALDLESRTVLVIAFDREAGLARRSTGLTGAFRDACVGLSPELEVAFVTFRQTGDLCGLVAEREREVVDRAGPALLGQDFPLLYLTDRADYGVLPGIVTGFGAELPVAGGRLWAEDGPSAG